MKKVKKVEKIEEGRRTISDQVQKKANDEDLPDPEFDMDEISLQVMSKADHEKKKDVA